MLNNETMNARLMSSFLNTNDKTKGALTESSFRNVVDRILEDIGIEDLESSEEYFGLNVLSEEFTCDNRDWYAVDDQLDCWSVIVSAISKEGKLSYIMGDSRYCDSLVAIEVLGITVVFNCLIGVVSMLIHRSDIEVFVKNANNK